MHQLDSAPHVREAVGFALCRAVSSGDIHPALLSMKILALLPSDARHALERALTEDQDLAKVTGAESAVASLRDGRCDAFVFDPGLLDAADFEVVMRAVNESRVPMLIYTELEPLSARRIVEVVDFTAREMVLRGADDMPELLHRKLGVALVKPSTPARDPAQQGRRTLPFLSRAVADRIGGAVRALATPAPRWGQQSRGGDRACAAHGRPLDGQRRNLRCRTASRRRALRRCLGTASGGTHAGRGCVRALWLSAQAAIHRALAEAGRCAAAGDTKAIYPRDVQCEAGGGTPALELAVVSQLLARRHELTAPPHSSSPTTG